VNCSRVHEHCVKVIKLPSHSILVTIKFEMKIQEGMKRRAYLLLLTEGACSADDVSLLPSSASGGEDACSADGFLPIASLYLPSVFTCMRVPFVFSAAFEAEKMMKRPACWEFVLILGFRCLQGRRHWQGQYSSLCIAALLFSPSLCLLFLSLDLCSVFPLFFSPVSGFLSGFSFSSAPPCFRLSPHRFLAC